jgi:hypothetical protein
MPAASAKAYALRAGIGIGVVVALLLTGCGDEDSGSSTTNHSGRGASSSVNGEDLGEALGEAGSTTTTTADPARPTMLLRLGVVSVPATAADGLDRCSNPISYAAENLVDQVNESAWRMDGDGTGQSLTFSLDGSHHLSEVGIVPGYAKIDPCDGADRFVQNRRVTTATWLFDDGSSVTQPLVDTPTMQTTAVNVTTTNVVLRIDGVTSSPERDFTALSEVTVRGS